MMLLLCYVGFSDSPFLLFQHLACFFFTSQKCMQLPDLCLVKCSCNDGINPPGIWVKTLCRVVVEIIEAL